MNKLFTKKGTIKYSSILKISVIISLFIVAITKVLDQQTTVASASFIALSTTIFFVVLETLVAIHVSFIDLESKFKLVLKRLTDFTNKRIRITFTTIYVYFYKNHNCDYQYLYKKFHVIRC